VGTLPPYKPASAHSKFWVRYGIIHSKKCTNKQFQDNNSNISRVSINIYNKPSIPMPSSPASLLVYSPQIKNTSNITSIWDLQLFWLRVIWSRVRQQTFTHKKPTYLPFCQHSYSMVGSNWKQNRSILLWYLRQNPIYTRAPWSHDGKQLCLFRCLLLSKSNKLLYVTW